MTRDSKKTAASEDSKSKGKGVAAVALRSLPGQASKRSTADDPWADNDPWASNKSKGSRSKGDPWKRRS
jgi:hypothetical protein